MKRWSSNRRQLVGCMVAHHEEDCTPELQEGSFSCHVSCRGTQYPSGLPNLMHTPHLLEPKNGKITPYREP